MICFRNVVVVLMQPYLWLLYRICTAYADFGSFYFMYPMCSWYLYLRSVCLSGVL